METNTQKNNARRTSQTLTKHEMPVDYEIPRNPTVEDSLLSRARAVTAQFRSLRAREGVQSGDRQWVTPLISSWLDALGPKSQVIDDSSLMKLGVGMRESLPIRDAVILSIAGNSSLDQLVDVACDPLSARSHEVMVENFSAVFHSPSFVPILPRCTKTIALLGRMNRLLPKGYTAQPLAVVGYLYWWMGNMLEAKAIVNRVLHVDSQCTFAVILMRTIENHVLPAWMSVHDLKKL